MKTTIMYTVLAVVLTAATLSAQSPAQPSECVPVLKDCSRPVKWIADKDDCSCYACEYGKSTVHTGCTRDKQMKAELVKLQGAGSDDQVVEAVMTLKGTLKEKGGKYTFVNDKDGKSLAVANPETLKGHEGHHVAVTGHVYADQIQIMGVRMIGGDYGKR